jgi:hypothetical protein
MEARLLKPGTREDPRTGPAGFGKGSVPGPLVIMMAVSVLLWCAACGTFVRPRGEPLPVRETAPEFSLQSQNGETVSLPEILKQGPVLIVFYRGHW